VCSSSTLLDQKLTVPLRFRLFGMLFHHLNNHHINVYCTCAPNGALTVSPLVGTLGFDPYRLNAHHHHHNQQLPNQLLQAKHLQLD
jgi:hypothetical protein